jgi:hypothetical protein
MSLFTPSGGLVYHLRAFRHRAGLWAPFRQAIEAWLGAELSGPGELILVGPSAGHCLPEAVLLRFERVLALEPDPVARWLLRRKLTHGALELESRDLLVEPLLRGEQGLPELLVQRPSASVLFCNLLGQLELVLSEQQQLEFQRAFRERVLPALAGRRWASFHDRWSLDRSAREPKPVMRSFPGQPSADALAAAWFGETDQPLTVLDHATSELFPSEWPRRYFSWQITPGALHVVEGLAGPKRES